MNNYRIPNSKPQIQNANVGPGKIHDCVTCGKHLPV